MKGSLVTLEVDSAALAGNPLGNPSRRPVHVYVPPGGARGRPAAYFLHGFTGSGPGWLLGGPFGPSVPERLDALVAAGEVPPIAGVFIDGRTALGGTQWIDAPAVGRYQSYVADDVVGLVERELGTSPRREARAVLGKSSGGYGTLAMVRDRSATFAHAACHAGDAFFEYAYLGDLPKAAGALLAAGGDLAGWLEGMKRRAREAKLRPDDIPVVNVFAMAANYADEPVPRLRPAARAYARDERLEEIGAVLAAALPFDPETARPRDEVWARWLEQDPVRFVPRALDAFRSLETCYVDCGTRDEFNLRWGARMVVAALRAGGVEVVHEEFEDGHMGIDYRYAASLRVLGRKLRP
ncbi:MAG: alpha/beta hydrolase-fold protein [Anaeromyxobacteraceae bacterium]